MDNKPENGGTHISGQHITIGALSTGSHSTANNYQTQDKEAPTGEIIHVLFVLANPRGSDDLRLNGEMRAIQEALRLSQQREHIRCQILPAATTHDLRRALLDKPYAIIHLAGHGSPAGFFLEDEQGQAQLITREMLAWQLSNYHQTLRCVIFNACYSFQLGQGNALGVPYVIAMPGPIDDQAAIEFSRGFYDGLGAGADIERAYREGLSAVRFAGLDRHFRALLLRA